jgi:hypothetical protein
MFRISESGFQMEVTGAIAGGAIFIENEEPISSLSVGTIQDRCSGREVTL